ncbi:30S ribosome-binding factor RbfA [Patescibacteria group bacterium]|nr:30S ribosome-binding factor RbfA [Patescibacteria group bacterium]
MSNRIQRVNALIKNELSQILLKEVGFPKDTLVTITRVESSVNLNQAKIYISVMSEDNIDEVFEILNRRIYDIQQTLNRRLKMRPIPKIEFKKEEKTEEAARVEELLEEIKNEEKG